MTIDQALTVHDVYPAVHARIERLLDDLADDRQMHQAVALLLQTRAPEDAMLLTPLLVHDAEAENPGDAVAIASAHHLWWLAAHVMDDVIDSAPLTYNSELGAGESVMAAVCCGISLPTKLICADFPSATATAILREYADAWTTSNNGQIRDLRNQVGNTSCGEVLRTYRDKNGAAYGMACAAAALAAGAAPSRVEAWREFGYALGTVGQFRNDQEDIVSGEHEDLHNGTATFLLTHFLENCCTTADRRRWLALLGSGDPAPEDLEALVREMTDPRCLAGYYATIAEMHDRVVTLLRDLTEGLRERPVVRQLHVLADRAAAPVDGFPRVTGRLPTAGAAPAAS